MFWIDGRLRARMRHAAILNLAMLLAGCGASLDSASLESVNATGTLNGAKDTAQATPDGKPQSELKPDLAWGAASKAAPAAADPATTTALPRVPMAVPGALAAVGGYRIGPKDILDVSVFKVPELSKTVTVADTGTVNLPLVGEVKVAGLTPQDVERELTRQLGAKYLQSPQVTVAIKEYHSQRITIDGSVKKPGVKPYRGSETLLQVIASAEGLTDNADSTVMIFRTIDGKRSAARFDVSEIQSGAAPDPEVQPGDVIIAGASAVKAAFQNVSKLFPLAGAFLGIF